MKSPKLFNHYRKISSIFKSDTNYFLKCFEGNIKLYVFCSIFIFAPFYVSARHKEKPEAGKNISPANLSGRVNGSGDENTTVSGKVTDAGSNQPLAFISVKFNGSKYGVLTDKQGKFYLSAPGNYNRVTFSYLGYQSITRNINPGEENVLNIAMHSSQTQLKEVSVTSGKKERYRNKGNPAVELIREVISHKEENRMESTDYLQNDQYERINLSFVDIPPALINNRYFKMYKFMLDTVNNGDKKQALLPAYFSEKIFKNYYRKSPEKTIKMLTAQKESNVLKFIDTAGLDIYLNRLYGNNIDIYANNIFIISNQFLSPIADHAPDFYKFFITDTIQAGKNKLIEISFTPRNQGDLLFEGKLLVTQDGHYVVQSCELNVNKHININFVRSLQIRLDFLPFSGGRYYLNKSDVKADFGIFRNKGFGVTGERTVVFENYLLNSPHPDDFYKGKSVQTEPDADKPDTTYWAQHRPDTLTTQQARVYPHVSKLEKMPQFKRATWLAATLTGGYAAWGPVQLGPIGSFFAYDSEEGPRFQIGGRTTPALNKTLYFEGYTAYGTRDKQLKYSLSTYVALNKTAFYRFPNDYFKLTYQYDIGVPGQNFSLINQQAALSSFQSGKTAYWIYNRIFKVEYVKDFENHFSYNLAFKNWDQQPAGTLIYQNNAPDNQLVDHLRTSEVDLGLRYAPHEQLLQGTVYRRTIHSKYPILYLQINHGIKGLFNGSYNYTSLGANIYKRFYLSQLGFADVTVLGGYLAGKVPFPLLSISPANQSIAYNPSAYNQMTYLEFVSDHYAGVNVTQSFNGFFLNKIPLIEHLKWREYLTGKILFGGLRNENNPLYSAGLYNFPAAGNGANGTYALGAKPYIEGGVGIGNIFKFLRIDGIKRFNYLDHPGASRYGVKLSFSPDF